MMIIAHAWHGDPWGVLGALVALAFIALVAVALVALLRPVGRGYDRDRADARRTQAIRVLEERYARGEISREEYQERRTVLSAPPPPNHPD